jgi:hypothetical protein
VAYGWLACDLAVFICKLSPPHTATTPESTPCCI